MFTQLYVRFAVAFTNGEGDSFDLNLPKNPADTNTLAIGLQVIFGVLGAIAVIMVIYGGMRYVRSQGNPQELTKAREAIMYAIIGLAIAVLAEAIINFTIRVI